MSKSATLKLSLECANWLFQNMAFFQLPKKLGTKEYDDVQRAIVSDEVRSAFQSFKGYSHYPKQVGADQRIIFGHKEDIEIGKDEKGNETIKYVDPSKEYDIALTGEGVNGLVWLAFVILFPHDPSEQRRAATPALADMYVWPAIQQLKKGMALRAALGLTAVDKKYSWPDDEVKE